MHYTARYNNIKAANSACDPRFQINVNRVSEYNKEKSLTNRSKKLKNSKILLRFGAKDKTTDIHGRYAYEYIRYKEIKELFIENNMKTFTAPMTRSQTKRKAELEIQWIMKKERDQIWRYKIYKIL